MGDRGQRMDSRKLGQNPPVVGLGVGGSGIQSFTIRSPIRKTSYNNFMTSKVLFYDDYTIYLTTNHLTVSVNRAPD